MNLIPPSTCCSGTEVLRLLASDDQDSFKLNKLLARAEFQINGVNSSGLSPLKAAVINGDAKSVAVLLRNGAIASGDVIEFAETSYPHKPDVIFALRGARRRDIALEVLSAIS